MRRGNRRRGRRVRRGRSGWGNTAGGITTIGGFADELRISNIARTAAWIAAEYSNQKSPGTFASVGPVQNASGLVGPHHRDQRAGGFVAYRRRSWVHGALQLAVDAGIDSFDQCEHHPASRSARGRSTSLRIGLMEGRNRTAVTAPPMATTYVANLTTQYFLTTSATTAARSVLRADGTTAVSAVSVSATALSGTSSPGSAEGR